MWPPGWRWPVLSGWPFVVKEPAKRSSINRERGTLVTKPVNVNGKVYSEFMKSKVLPSIREKWPVGKKNNYQYFSYKLQYVFSGEKRTEIKIQQDNATPHKREVFEIMAVEGKKDGWNISLFNHPPNNPSINILDLSYFNSIQSLQIKENMVKSDDLIGIVDI